VLECASRVHVGLLGVRDPRQVNEHLGLQVIEPGRERTLVAGVEDVQRYAALPEQVQCSLTTARLSSWFRGS